MILMPRPVGPRPKRHLPCNGFIHTPRGAAPYGVSVGGAADSPAECDNLSGWVRRGGNQQWTETCLAWAYAGAIWATLGLLGLPRNWPSVLRLYYLARLKKVGGDKSLLWDGGSSMLASAEVLRETGWVPEALWQFDPAKVDKEPPWGAIVEGLREDWIAPQRILAYGTELEREIKARLSAPGRDARYIIRGIPVDQQYLDWQPGDPPWVYSGNKLGRHAELSAHYGVDWLGKVSSWGDLFDRKESWENVRNEYDAETWVVDVNPEAMKHNLKLMGVMR